MLTSVPSQSHLLAEHNDIHPAFPSALPLLLLLRCYGTYDTESPEQFNPTRKDRKVLTAGHQVPSSRMQSMQDIHPASPCIHHPQYHPSPSIHHLPHLQQTTPAQCDVGHPEPAASGRCTAVSAACPAGGRGLTKLLSIRAVNLPKCSPMNMRCESSNGPATPVIVAFISASTRHTFSIFHWLPLPCQPPSTLVFLNRWSLVAPCCPGGTCDLATGSHPSSMQFPVNRDPDPAKNFRRGLTRLAN